MLVVEEVLYFLGSVLAGIVLGFAVIYVISKIRGKPMFSVAKQTQVATQEVSTQTNTIPVKVKENSVPPRKDTLEVLLENHKKPEPVSEKPTTIPNSRKPTAITVSEKPATVPESRKPVAIPVSEKPATVFVRDKPATVPVSEKPATVPVSEKPTAVFVRDKPATVPVSGKTAAVKEQKLNVNSEIYQEFVLNFTIATAPWSGKLTSFQTVAWEGGNLGNEPSLADFQEEITQAYVDIHLANSIVWLSNETGHHSAELDESYKELSTKIAERLKKVIASPKNVK